MPVKMRHGIITPASREGVTPGRVVNARSRRKESENIKIRLDRLLRSPNPKILVKRRLGGIGDVIMTTPMLKAIKNLLPHCELTYATDCEYSNGALKDAIEHCPFVDQVVPNGSVQDNHFDYSVDVTTTGLRKEKSGSYPPNRIDMFAEEAGIDITRDPIPVYELTADEIAQSKEDIKKLLKTDVKNIIAIQARSNDARRTWPAEHVSGLVDLLSENKDNHILLFDWGNSVDKWEKKARNVSFVFDKTLNETAMLLHQSDVVVCPDSAILHLAAALNKKTVTVFGPIPPESRINHYPNTVAVTKHLLCHPCWYSPTCRKNNGMTLECLTGVSPQQVEQAVYKKLEEELLIHKNIIFGKDLTDKKQDPVILVRRESAGLGDILMTTPAIAALKEKYPDKQIEVACQRQVWPAIQNNPNIDKISDCNDSFNYRRYFMVIEVSVPCARYESSRIASGKPVQKSRVEIFAEAMKVRNSIKDIVPEYYIKEEEKEWAKKFLSSTVKSDKPKIAVGLRSAEEYRNWPEEYNRKLFDLLSKDFELIILDHSRKEMYKDTIDACGFELRRAIAILSQCDGLITVDTGLLHFGAALDIPTIALFGPIDYRARCKGYKHVTVMVSEIKCSPCWRNGNMKCKETGRIKGNSKCMQMLSAKQVALTTKRKFK